MKKFLSVLTAATVVAAFSATAGAYSINKDLGFGWSSSVTISGDEFADATAGSTVTFTYNVNEALADMEGQDYWCIKPMINDSGWPFIEGMNDDVLSESGDSYTIDMESSSITLAIPADSLEHLQTAGMAIMGHGIELLEMTISDDPVTVPAEETPVEEVPAEDAVVEESPAEDNSAPAATKGNPDTGIEGIAAAAGVAVLAAGVMFFSKRK